MVAQVVLVHLIWVRFPVRQPTPRFTLELLHLTSYQTNLWRSIGGVLASVTQLVEYHVANVIVAGSNPVARSKE